MDLKRFLEDSCIIKKGFAKKVGITESTLHRILSKKTHPSTKTAQKIVEVTHGEVTFEDLFKKKDKK